MKCSIVVPCYNESKNIPLILNRFKESIDDIDLEVVLVNNGSTDDSAQIFEKELPNFPFAKVVTIEVNEGYGHGIITGLKNATGEFIGWTHADMQTDPNDVVKAFKLLMVSEDKKKMVKGLRKGRPLFDEFFTVGMSFFESMYLGTKLFDINAQPNVFPKSLFDSWENPPKDFSLDLFALYMAKRNGLEVERFDVLFPERIHGSSSWNTGLKSKYKFIKRTLDFSFKLKKELK